MHLLWCNNYVQLAARVEFDGTMTQQMQTWEKTARVKQIRAFKHLQETNGNQFVCLFLSSWWILEDDIWNNCTDYYIVHIYIKGFRISV